MADEIEIRTAHNIVVYYTLASPIDRLVGLILDLVVMAVLSVAVALTLSFALNSEAFLQVMILLIWSFYHLLFEVFNRGQSPGKMLIKTKVVNLRGLSPSPGEALLRWIFRLLDFTLSVGCVGGISIFSSPKNQRIGDLVSGCIVIKQKKSGDISLARVLSIQDRERQVLYPQVARYEEKDMILIKEVLSRHQKWKNQSTKRAIMTLSDKIAEDLKVSLKTTNRITLLEDVIKDYVVLTR